MCYWTGSEGETKRNVVRFTCVYFKMGSNNGMLLSPQRSMLMALGDIENSDAILHCSP